MNNDIILQNLKETKNINMVPSQYLSEYFYLEKFSSSQENYVKIFLTT